MKYSYLISFAIFSIIIAVAYSDKISDEQPGEDVKPEKLEYAKGSLCKYCDYCKVCSPFINVLTIDYLLLF